MKPTKIATGDIDTSAKGKAEAKGIERRYARTSKAGSKLRSSPIYDPVTRAARNVTDDMRGLNMSSEKQFKADLDEFKKARSDAMSKRYPKKAVGRGY